MKKITLILLLMAGFHFVAIQTNAQTATSPDQPATIQTSSTERVTPGTFVDNNKDGVCDHRKGQSKRQNCSNFTDKNGDGVCDYCKGSGTCGQGNCCSKGATKGNCPGMAKGCCGKGTPNHGGKGCTQPAKPLPEKK